MFTNWTLTSNHKSTMHPIFVTSSNQWPFKQSNNNEGPMTGPLLPSLTCLGGRGGGDKDSERVAVEKLEELDK